MRTIHQLMGNIKPLIIPIKDTNINDPRAPNIAPTLPQIQIPMVKI